ncbi:MAG: bifunctional DNA-formamidopyrimidine glycosylase/DNA-(apurinic or apyrimidinic site) lyase [Phycisphaerales bacterium]
MPELPEVENVRLGLADTVVGQRVVKVVIRRTDVVEGLCSPAGLLRGQTIARIDRLGKQLALVAGTTDGPCVCVHLGMTGSLRYYPAEQAHKPDAHTHVVWRLENGGQVVFRDPRRFGGLWVFHSVTELRAVRWSGLGEDALAITPVKLYRRLRKTRRPAKSALLDQTVVAGLGNIYVDELLYGCRISPLRPACDLTLPEIRAMVGRMRRLLDHAIRAGGSTLRDYVDAGGRSGGYQLKHKVYGRGGQACLRCDQPLCTTTASGRTTVYCGNCQA